MKSKWIISLAILTVVMITGVIGVTSASLNDTETSTNNAVRTINNWYDLAWHWRKPLTISNGGGALTDFQVRLSLDTLSLVNAGKMQANGNDIRFTTADGQINLNYWIESGMGTAATAIWIKIPAVAAGNSTIYLYYGNTSATAAASGANTFIFFDNFDGGDVSKWTTGGTGTKTAVTSPAADNGNYSMSLTRTGGTYTATASFTSQTLTVIEYSARAAQTNAIWETQIRNTGTTVGPHLRLNNDASIEYEDSSWKDFSPVSTYAANTWYHFRLSNVDVATDTYSVYIDGNLKKSGTAFDNNTTNVAQIRFQSANNSTVYIDLVKVRKYAAAEPVLSSIGGEE